MAESFREIDIAAAYAKYTEEVKKKIGRAVRDNGGRMRDKNISNSPVRRIKSGHRIPKNANPGEYKAGWVMTVKNTGTCVRAIVHNKIYKIVHLQELEHKTGKENVNRGAYPAGGQNDVIGSIRAANRKYSDKLNEEIQKILEE